MADLNKSTDANQDKSQLELVNVGNTTKEDLVEGLSEEKLECPFPEDKLYSEVWNKYKSQPEQQELMKKNIGPMIDGKREIIPMKKKFSILTAIHNGTTIFDGSYVDKKGNTGKKGITYLTGKAAQRECWRQNKRILLNLKDIEQLISYFPGEETEEIVFTEKGKIPNLIELFGLKNTGWRGPSDGLWSDFYSNVFVSGPYSNDSRVTRISCTDKGSFACVESVDEDLPSPCLVYEDC